MVSISITIDTTPESPDLDGQTTIELQRPTEDAAAIAALAILISLYGRNLKTATEHYSDVITRLNATIHSGESADVVSR